MKVTVIRSVCLMCVGVCEREGRNVMLSFVFFFESFFLRSLIFQKKKTNSTPLQVHFASSLVFPPHTVQKGGHLYIQPNNSCIKQLDSGLD